MHENILICSCNSTEHQLVISKYDDPLYGPEIYIQVHLVKRSFWYRLKYAVMYLFGYKSLYGAWDEFILQPKHARQLDEIVQHLLSNETQRITV